MSVSVMPMMRFLSTASSNSEAVAFDGSIGLDGVRTGANMLILLHGSLGSFSVFPHRSPGGPAEDAAVCELSVLDLCG